MESGFESPADRRRTVIDDLNLPMLFLDVGAVIIRPDDDGPDVGHAPSRIRAAIETDEHSSAAAAASLLCRVLYNPLVSTVHITRESESVRLECRYPASNGNWTVELTTMRSDCTEVARLSGTPKETTDSVSVGRRIGAIRD